MIHRDCSISDVIIDSSSVTAASVTSAPKSISRILESDAIWKPVVSRSLQSSIKNKGVSRA